MTKDSIRTKKEEIMARDIILDVCDAIRGAASASDIEEICRYEIAQEMEYQDRILDDAEIEGIVDDVVRSEALVDPIDNIDDGVLEMTDIEWENIPSEYKVVDTDGDESAIIEGSIYKVSLHQDMRPMKIASKIAKEIESAWNLRNAAHGIAADISSYRKVGSDVSGVCPECGSDDQTVVWYDDSEQYVHCNACGAEYSESFDEESASIEELTVEDITIYEDEDESLFGSVFYDGELGWTWQIWHNGACIEQELADDAGQAYGIFNAVKAAYEDIAIGESLKSPECDGELVIEDIIGDTLVCGGEKVSRAQTAVDLVMGRVFTDDSDLYAFDVDEGDSYRNLHGEEIEVVEAANGNILYLASEIDPYTHDYRSEYRISNKNAFVGYLVDKGYLS